MILLQKFNEHNEELKGWTTILENQDELVAFMIEHKGHLLGSGVHGGYHLKIEEIKEKKPLKTTDEILDKKDFNDMTHFFDNATSIEPFKDWLDKKDKE